MTRAARTIWKHIEEILSASMLGVSNALSESINSKVQWIKRQACGYRDRRNFRAAIYFTWKASTSTLALLSTRNREASQSTSVCMESHPTLASSDSNWRKSFLSA